MSLINQMLKDLEQRGGFPSDTKFEPATSKSLGTDTVENKGKNTFLKISGALILLYCAVYLWVKNPNLFKAPHVTETPSPAVTAPAPAAVQTPVNPATTVAPLAPIAAAQAPVPPATALVEQVQPLSPNPVDKTPNPIEKNSAEDTSQTIPQQKQKVVEVNEPTPQKVAKKASSQKIVHNIDKESTSLNFEDIAPATIAPVEIKKSKSAVRNTTNPQSEAFTKQENPTQKSANLYRFALLDLQKGRSHEAEDNLAKAIQENPANEEARQTLAALLVDRKKMTEAQDLLTEGLKLNPQQTGFRMAVARLLLESGDKQSALDTLMQGISYARKNADYQSFLATLLQRAERHEEAIDYYNAAIALQATNASTYVGLGISLQALGKFEEAQNAFTRALSNSNLSPELTGFAELRLKQVNQQLK